jgi:hypothetical protein
MNSRFEQLEDLLVSQLSGSFFDVAPVPDTQAEYRNTTRPRVYVIFDNADYPDNDMLGAVAQEQKIKIGCEIYATARRGATGIFAIQQIIYQQLLGYPMPGCDPLQLVSFGPLAGSGPNQWAYYVQLSTSDHVAQALDFSADDGPSFQSLTLESDEQNLHQ